MARESGWQAVSDRWRSDATRGLPSVESPCPVFDGQARGSGLPWSRGLPVMVAINVPTADDTKFGGVLALDDVSFDVRGGICGPMGPNGPARPR